MLHCESSHSTSISYYEDILYVPIMLSDSIDLIKYYLSLAVTADVKNEFLDFFVKEKNDDMNLQLNQKQQVTTCDYKLCKR